MQKEQIVNLLGLWKRDCHDDVVAWSTDLRFYL